MHTVYTVEHYLAIKKKKMLPFATTWVKLEGIILSKISQTQKEKYCIFSHVESKKFELTDIEGNKGGCQGQRGWGKWRDVKG